MQVLVYRDHYDKEPRSDTITKVLKNQLVTADGSRWTLRGDAWGSSGQWFREHIRPYTEEIAAEIAAEKLTARRKRMRRAAVRFIERDLSLEEVERLYELLRNKGMPEVE